MNIGHTRMLRLAGVSRRAGKALSSDALDAEWASIDAAKTASVDPVQDAATRYLAALVAALRADVQEQGIDALQTFDLAAWVERQEEELRPALYAVMERGWEAGLLRIDQVQPWDPEDSRIAEFGAELLRKSRTVPQTVLGQAETALRSSVADGATREEMIDALREALKDVPTTNAETIAQTAGTGAFEAGQVTSWLASGVSRHMWLSSRDSLVRESHAALDGEEVEVGETFSNGLRFPADPAGDASEAVRCRCDLVPVMVADDEEAKRLGPRAWRVERDDRLRREYKSAMAGREDGWREAVHDLAEAEDLAFDTVRKIVHSDA